MKVKCVHRAHAPSTPSYFSPTQTTAPFVRRTDAKSHWLHLYAFSPKGVFRCFLKSPAWIDGKSQMVALVRFFQLSPQIVCPKWSKDALVAFLHFFTWESFQMFSQIDFSPEGVFRCSLKSPAWIDGKLQMVALVRFFQLSPQIVCLNWCKVTFFAFLCFSPEWVWVSSICLPVHMQSRIDGICTLFLQSEFECPQIACLYRCKVTLIAFERFFTFLPLSVRHKHNSYSDQ